MRTLLSRKSRVGTHGQAGDLLEFLNFAFLAQPTMSVGCQSDGNSAAAISQWLHELGPQLLNTTRSAPNDANDRRAVCHHTARQRSARRGAGKTWSLPSPERDGASFSQSRERRRCVVRLWRLLLRGQQFGEGVVVSCDIASALARSMRWETPRSTGM